MPTYEYFCQDCENKFEKWMSLSEKEKSPKVNCPGCGGSKTVQILGSFLVSSKGDSNFGRGGFNFGGGCGPNFTPGCCG